MSVKGWNFSEEQPLYNIIPVLRSHDLTILTRAANDPSLFTIKEKALTLSFTFKTLC